MTTLRVLLSENWPDEPAADWALLADDGRVETTGHTEPRDWPASTRTEAILLGAQTAWHLARVPRAGHREQQRALPFALEEQLLREPDSQHFTATERGAEQWAVLVIARERIRRIVAQFAAIGRPLDAIWSALQCVPLEPGNWSLALHGEDLCLRTGAHAALADRHDGNLPWLLEAACHNARVDGSLPSQILVFADHMPYLPAWSDALNVPMTAADTWQWHRVPAEAANLLHGEFAPAHRRHAWVRHLKPAGALAAAVIVGHLALSVVDIWIRRAELGSLRRDMQQLMQRQLPNTPILDPQAQLRQEVDAQRAKRGLLGDDDTLSLLADVAAALGNDAQGVLQSARAERGVLSVTLAAGRLDTATLRARLATRGIVATPIDGANIAFRLNRG
ncbi:type II secretion system protein GspL [Uliginosibacterium sp. H1]|uniref:type II secretion system protein GspL n=1 Tax=Uliginosibacterium sp. H1 TaxID=3114757 RepID=UPI002E18F439|nr:type II secretion system protein GspL [Uliginosibacterium sp. H1]